MRVRESDVYKPVQVLSLGFGGQGELTCRRGWGLLGETRQAEASKTCEHSNSRGGQALCCAALSRGHPNSNRRVNGMRSGVGLICTLASLSLVCDLL